MSYLLHRHARH